MFSLETFTRERGLPPALGSALAARGLAEWTPLQARAWEEGVDRPEEDWLVTAPTSAGKSLVAEMRAARHLVRGEKVLWLCPTRALADALGRQLRADLGPAGFRVVVATADSREGEEAVLRGAYDLLVTVPEMALSGLLREPHVLGGVGLAIADELALLADPERGPRFDVLLALIRESPYRPWRLGLAPPLANGRAVAAWWGGRWLVDGARPRPLREGVLDARSGRFRWRDRAGGTLGEERLAPAECLLEWLTRAGGPLGFDDHPPLRALTGALAGGLAARGESTLLFAPTRALARRWAVGLARAFEMDPDAALLRELNRLARLEPCGDLTAAAAAAEGGVGLHHGDLPAPARRAVEEAFAAGRIGLVVATPTLAQGVNLIARNVIQWPHGPGRAPRPGNGLEPALYHDQAGRAGRMGLGSDPGRAVLVAWDEAQGERLWQRFVEPEPPALHSPLKDGGLAALILPALAGDVARSRENLVEFLGMTLGGAQAESAGRGEFAAEVGRALGACEGAHLVRPMDNPADPLRLSSLGQIAALYGIGPGQAAQLRSLADMQAGDEDPLPALWGLALAAPAGSWPAARPGRSAMAAEARRWLAARGLEMPPWLGRVLDRPGGPEACELGALEAGARLARWIGPEGMLEIEWATGWSAGMLERAGEALGWLAGATAAIAALGGSDGAVVEAWRTLAARLSAGLPAAAAELARLNVAEAGRTSLLRLHREGLSSPHDLAASPEEFIARAVGDTELARRIREQARALIAKGERRREADWASAPAGPIEALPAEAAESGPGYAPASPAAHAARPPNLHIDLKSPCIVRVGEREVRLRPQGFDLLAMLAEAPGCVVQRAALYHRLWGDEGPEDQQLDRHRRLVEAAMRPALNGHGPNPLIEVVRGVGYRLALPPETVRLERG